MSEEIKKVSKNCLLQLDEKGEFKTPIKEFLEGVGAGMPVKYACDLAMINPETIYNYINIAKEDEKKGLDEKSSIFIRFSNSIKNARAKCMFVNLEEMNNRDKGWQANAWKLERMFRNEFSANSVNTDNTDKIEVVPDVPKHEEN